jgi:hypothetical protein
LNNTESPLKLAVKGKFLKEIAKPSFAQVGQPYIMTVDYCNITNLTVSVYASKKSCSGSQIMLVPLTTTNAATTSCTAVATATTDGVTSPVSCSRQHLSSVAHEKTIESDSKLRVKFVPLDSIEHVVDIADNGVSIEGFPLRLAVFPNRDVFMVCENVNGVRVGSVARFRIYLNEQKESLNVKITSEWGNLKFPFLFPRI